MGVTSPIGLPWPDVTDRVADGWDAVRDLAEAVDDAIVADRVSLAGKATPADVAAEAAARAAADAALSARASALESDSGWIELPLSVGWVAYGSGFAAPAYRRRHGLVHLRGMVKAPGIPEHAVEIGVLPAGYRPAGLEIFIGGGQLSTSGLTDLGIRVEILGGAIRPTLAATSGGGAVAWVSLSGISFPADA